jgi:hypothetical protein
MLVFKPPAFSGARACSYSLGVLGRHDDLSALLTLRKRAFLRAGRLSAQASTAEDAWDVAAQTLHVIATQHEALRGAVRVTFKNWTDPVTVLPCAAHFPAIRSAGLRKLSIAEMSHLVTQPELSEAAGAVIHAALLRSALLAAHAARIAMIVTATTADRAAFYAQVLRFHPIGTPAPYPPGDVPFTLTDGSMVGAAGRGIARHSFFGISEEEVSSMRFQLASRFGATPAT